jgi:hypothetical protein
VEKTIGIRFPFVLIIRIHNYVIAVTMGIGRGSAGGRDVGKTG